MASERSAKRAYYIEWPNKEMAVMLKFDGASPEVSPTILTADYIAPETLIAGLMTDGYETLSYSYEPADREWLPIDLRGLPEVTLCLEGPDGIMYGKRRQLRSGQVVEAGERGKGKSQWHVDGAPPLPAHYVEPVALPVEFEAEPEN